MPLVPPGSTGGTPVVQAQREEAPESTALASTAAPTLPPAAVAGESEQKVDVTQLADQVYEMLVHRLATERERRGF
jgi:hypothetical protein